MKAIGAALLLAVAIMIETIPAITAGLPGRGEEIPEAANSEVMGTETSDSEGSVPESIIAFLESTDYESAIRLAISLGGDADTMAAIAGGIAEAYYQEIPPYIVEEVQKRLPQEFIEVMQRFYEKFVDKYSK